MLYNKIHNTDLEVSALCLGTWVFGGKFWGGTIEQDCIDAVHCAMDYGFNFIDTAPIYGNGKSETIIGRALKGKRNRWIIASKCGLVTQGPKIVHNLTAQSIRKEVEESLKRLQTDFIDLYQCHWPDLDTPIEQTLETLCSLKEEGKVRHIGLSNFNGDLFEQACQIAEMATAQNQYSLLERSIENDLLPFLREQSIGLLAYGPLAGGILTGKYQGAPKFQTADARKYFYLYYEGEAFEQTQALVNRLRELGKPLNQLAINWVRQQPGVASVLVGCRNPQQVETNATAIQWEIPNDTFKRIDDMLQEMAYG